MTSKTNLKPGDKVTWDTPQGKTHGTIVKAVKGTETAGGHEAKASASDPQYRVKSAKTGKEAIHHPEALKKG